VVHRPLACLVHVSHIRPGSEVRGCSPLAQGIPSFNILDQPINFTQKVLLLCQVEVFHYFCIHWLPQLAPIVVGNRLVPGVLDDVLDNFLS
jgi:hypothetical protein